MLDAYACVCACVPDDVVDGKQRLTSLLCFYLAGEEREMLKTLMRTEKPILERLTKLDESTSGLKCAAPAMSIDHLPQTDKWFDGMRCEVRHGVRCAVRCAVHRL